MSVNVELKNRLFFPSGNDSLSVNSPERFVATHIVFVKKKGTPLFTTATGTISSLGALPGYGRLAMRPGLSEGEARRMIQEGGIKSLTIRRD